MSDYRVVHVVKPDDGSNGIFWRDGTRWLRENGKETPLSALAPNLEAQYMMKLALAEITARNLSK